MPRSRVDIQKDVVMYKSDLQCRNDTLNSPIWANQKHDPRYLELSRLRDEYALKLAKCELELAEAKLRGEKGRTQDEIRSDHSQALAEVVKWGSAVTDGSFVKGSLQWCHAVNVMQLFHFRVKALQEELDEAIAECR